MVNQTLFKQIEEKVHAGRRLSEDEGLAMLASQDLFALGKLADTVCHAKNDRHVFYSITRHISYTNICQNGCDFCHFGQEDNSSQGYTMTVDEITEQAAQASQQGATEIHIVGGINPSLSWDYFIQMIRSVRRTCAGLTIKAFTATEIHDFSKKSGLSIEEVLQTLMQEGLDALPGGGAEILNEQYFSQYCPAKPGPVAWMNVHRTAHRLGLPTNATMLFGFKESPAQRIEHLIQLRSLQDEAIQQGKAVFQCFVPLPYVPKNFSHSIHGIDILKTTAVSRLILDNFSHIKAFWPMMGVLIAPISLCFGADDLDGTVGQYRILETPQQDKKSSLTENQILALIQSTGLIPAKRDGFYRIVPT